MNASDTIRLLPVVIVIAVLASFLVVGMGEKARESSDYGLAGRYMGRIGGGAAIASNWMSAASFLGMAGILYLKGYLALAYVIGWTGGYVLLLVLMAAQIRRFGKYTAPEFVGDRYQSPAARLISAVVSICISLIYCVAQFKGIALIFSWLLGVPYHTAVVAAAVAVVSYIVVAGMLGVVKNQQMQYFVIITSFILPLMILSRKLGFFWILPQFGYGEAMQELSGRYGISLSAPFASGGLFSWVSLCFTLMVGTAGLPHVLSRFYVVPNIRDARWSVVWGLFFIALIYWSAPAYAVFARLLEARSGGAAAGAPDFTVMSAAIGGGVPDLVTGILAAGAVSAAFSTVAGLFVSAASSFSHDIYFRLINPRASHGRRVFIAKTFTLVLAAAVTLISLDAPGMIAEITATAFALAGNTIFPAFLLGIWWGRANRQGVIAGMVTGIAVTFAPILLAPLFPEIVRVLPATSSAIIGAPLACAVIVAVSLVTPPPPDSIRSFLSREIHGERP